MDLGWYTPELLFCLYCLVPLLLVQQLKADGLSEERPGSSSFTYFLGVLAFLPFLRSVALRFLSSFFMRRSTTLNWPLTPAGRWAFLPAWCFLATTYVTSFFFSCLAFLCMLFWREGREGKTRWKKILLANGIRLGRSDDSMKTTRRTREKSRVSKNQWTDKKETRLH